MKSEDVKVGMKVLYKTILGDESVLTVRKVESDMVWFNEGEWEHVDNLEPVEEPAEEPYEGTIDIMWLISRGFKPAVIEDLSGGLVDWMGKKVGDLAISIERIHKLDRFVVSIDSEDQSISLNGNDYKDLVTRALKIVDLLVGINK